MVASPLRKHLEEAESLSQDDVEPYVQRASLTANLIPRKNGFTPRPVEKGLVEKPATEQVAVEIATPASRPAAPAHTARRAISIEKRKRIAKTVRVPLSVQQQLLAIGKAKGQTQQALLMHLIEGMLRDQ